MTIGFIGCGRMGSALLEGALKAKLVDAKQIWVHDAYPGTADQLASKFGIQVAADNREVVRRCEMILLGCKPYQVIDILKETAPEIDPETTILSIAAGVTLGSMESASPAGTRIIRVMPNTPSLIGQGASGIAGGTHTSPDDLERARQILLSVGQVEIATEAQLDAVTALSGSGPAYIYRLIQSLAEQAETEGLPPEMALRLATQTVIGAGKMVEHTGMSPQDLIDQVTSPGGTTLAGLEALTQSGFESSIKAGVHAAAERSREIAAES